MAAVTISSLLCSATFASTIMRGAEQRLAAELAGLRSFGIGRQSGGLIALLYRFGVAAEGGGLGAAPPPANRTPKC